MLLNKCTNDKLLPEEFLKKLFCLYVFVVHIIFKVRELICLTVMKKTKITGAIAKKISNDAQDKRIPQNHMFHLFWTI